MLTFSSHHDFLFGFIFIEMFGHILGSHIFLACLLLLCPLVLVFLLLLVLLQLAGHQLGVGLEPAGVV